MRMSSKLKKAVKWSVLMSMIAVPAFVAFANVRVLDAGHNKTFEDLNIVPHHRVGIVLGCAPMIRGVKNPFFESRIAMAARLYHAGKVDRLLVSGDHGTKFYDEPTAMEEALLKKGVPVNAVTKDFAGFRTLDTMVRANKVFGLSDATVVTDDFHLARSLYFARGAGIVADGVPSKSAENNMTRTVEFREILARSQAVIDQEILHTGPKFLGKTETIN